MDPRHDPIGPHRGHGGVARAGACILAGVAAIACVPSGSAGGQDSGAPGSREPVATAAPAFVPSIGVMTAPFEDGFDHVVATSDATAGEPGPDWAATAPGIWHVEGGRLCGEHARNHGIWLRRVLPVNARIEFDAVADSPEGDIKAEHWGDGQSYATALSYTNATSYLTIFGGWHNQYHVLARINEHGADRKQIVVHPGSEDPREKPVVPGQIYHFKVERSDGRTVRWLVDGNEMLSWNDAAPLAGRGHDHFGFNGWDAKVCFDNVHIVPLP